MQENIPYLEFGKIIFFLLYLPFHYHSITIPLPFHSPYKNCENH